MPRAKVAVGAVSPSRSRDYASRLLSLSAAEMRDGAASLRRLFSISVWHLDTDNERRREA